MNTRALLALGLALLLPAPADSAAAEDPAPPSAVDRGRAALADGVRFLLSTQNGDGSFGHHAQARPYAIRAQIPGGHRAFKSATTGLALLALLRSDLDDPRMPAARERALGYLLAHGPARRADGDEIYAVWGLAYGLQAMSRCLAHPLPGMDADAVRAHAERIVDYLCRYQTVDGGWTYYDFNAQTARPSGDSMSFTTATVLIALAEARAVGVEAPPGRIAKAVRSLSRCRTPEGTYVYSFDWRYRPTGLINRRGGSLTRTPGCDLALHLFDAGVDLAAAQKGVGDLLKMAPYARMALRRPVPHESWYAVSGYFYLFGYYYAGEVLRRLPRESWEGLRDGLIEEVLYTRQPDGSFWDYPLYGYAKPYGTAYAVLALAEYLPPAR